jgi:hypothetical protein
MRFRRYSAEMGLFDKLFSGGAKQPEPATPPSPATPAGVTPPVARRERSKPLPPGSTPSSTPGSIPPPEVQSGKTAGENADLLGAISGVIAADTPESRVALYTGLLASDLFLVSMPGENSETLPAGEITLQEGQQLSLATIRDPDGRTFLPAFTDVDRLSNSLPPGEKTRYIRINAAAVCKMFLQGEGEGIVINPGQPPSGMISRAEAQVLATGAVPHIDENGQLVGTAPTQMRLMIAKPETPPAQSLVDAILAEAPKHPIVREVHMFKGGIEGQPPRLMIGLAVDDGLTPEQMHPSFQAIGKAAYDARGDTEDFDMMPLNEPILEAIRPLQAIIYLRDQQV